MLERESELGELERLIEDACAGHGRLVLVEGPAGIGKTELLAELGRRARQQGLLTLSARASELDRDFPFGIIRQLFEPLLGGADDSERARLLHGVAANAAPLFGIAGSEPVPSGAGASLVYFHALHWLIANLVERAPTVLALDDAHWADVSSLRFLRFLMPRLEELPALVALAARPREPGASGEALDALAADRSATVLRPAALSEEAVAELIAAKLSGPPEASFAEACHEATGGNPFLARELLGELAAEGVDPVAARAPLVRELAPATVSRAVLVRLARLVDDALALARAVAVLGSPPPLLRAAALAELSEERAAQSAELLARAGILSSARPLEFLHPILRAAVYHDLGPAERDRLHRRAAHLLADEGLGEQLIAGHLLATDPRGEADTAAALRAAAASARASGAVETAVACLRRALEEPPPVAERGALLLELASAEVHAGEPESAVEHFEEAGRMEIEPGELASSVRERALALAACGRLQEALTIAEEAVAALLRVDRELALLAEASGLAAAPFDWSRHGSFRGRIERYRGELDGESPGARMLLATQTWFDAYYGELPAAELAAEAERALGSGRLLDDTGGEWPQFFFALTVLILADHVDVAHGELDRALEAARQRGALPAFALASGIRCWLLAREGKLAAAVADGTIASELALEGGWFEAVPSMLGVILDALIDHGERKRAEALLEQSGMATRDGGENPMFIPVAHARARMRAIAGDHDGARRDFPTAVWPGARWNTLEASQPLILNAPELVRDRDQAREQAEHVLRDARKWATPRAIGIALRARGLLEPGARGIGLLEEAATTLEDSPARLEHARALADLGAALRRANQRKEARETLRRALDLAEACGAGPLAAQARSDLRAAGGRPRRPRTTGVDALTPSERRVAEMAADGFSNAEIAQALFITKKTVESHLAGTYGKLGIRSRTQLPVALREG